MYEKILAQLLAKHAGVSKVVLGLIAKKLADKVTEENQIEGAIGDFEANSPVSVRDYADLLQSEGDKRVTEALKKAKTETKESTENNDEKKDADDVPAWAKGMLETVADLKKELAGTKTKSTLEELVAKAKEKGIPEKYARKYQIGEGYDAEKALQEIESEWTEIKQSVINAEVGDGKVATGFQASGKSVSDAITKFAKKNVEAASAAKE